MIALVLAVLASVAAPEEPNDEPAAEQEAVAQEEAATQDQAVAQEDDGPSAQEIPDTVQLPTGTPIRLRLLDALSTKMTRKGETFELEVVEDVSAEGWLLIPAGTRAVGEVTRSDAKGAFGKSGKLEGRILYLELNGRYVRLWGALRAAGEGRTTETVLTTVAAGLLGFAVTGESAVLEVGTELIAETDRSLGLQPIGASE